MSGKEIHCRYCGERISKDVEFCPHCDSQNHEFEPSNSNSLEEDNKNEIHCRYCGERISKDVEFCPHCDSQNHEFEPPDPDPLDTHNQRQQRTDASGVNTKYQNKSNISFNGIDEVVFDNIQVSALLGVGAYVANYVLMYIFVIIDGVELGNDSWKTVGGILYNSQFISIKSSSGAQTLTFNIVDKTASREGYAQILEQSDIATTVPGIVYHLAPIITLVAAGLVVVHQLGSELNTETAAAKGATIAIGYLPPSVLGVFIFSSSSSTGEVTTSPELVPAIILAGLILPIGFGGIGGVLNNEL